ncbi:DUF1800 family protein [Luteolibacter sp. SL250]|uniref:DUF1800 family protein n=1 Tax=Luteolibacter sp. SL250 TaxID=2995170 RepID=UPI002271E9BC|nr:DUF1800 family protein [Luteolibacter sp. SL250]WAC18635.1 DUF1800 family protein [Luteolibacter sp. SL250]
MFGGTYPHPKAALPILCLAFVSTGWGKIDADGDGMSDVWQAAFGKSLIPSEDPDHDGFSNLLESIAGTDPLDGNSHPKVERFEVQPDTLKQVWNSVAGVRYQPLFSTDLSAWAPFGPVVVGTGEEMELTIDRATAFTSGGVEHLVWEQLPGWGLSQIKDRVANQTPPSTRGRLTALDIPQTSPDKAFFGQWIHGWIIPPETGTYQFFIASDDQSELWLSTDKSVANKRQIASVSEWTSHQQWDKFPSQTSAAITLTANTPYYFEVYQVEGDGGDNLSVAWQRPSMAAGGKEIIAGSVLSSTGQSLAEMGADRLFSRMEVSDADSDGDGLTDYEERVLGLDPSNATTTPRVADLDAAKKTLASPSSVNLGVSVARGYESTASPAEFIIFRAGGIEPLTVHYTVSGTAQAATDYLSLSGSVTIPAGARSVKIPVTPVADGEVEPQENVTITLQPGTGFTLGVPASATVQIDDSPDVLFIAQLRGTGSTPSAGTGVAAVTRSGNALTGQTSLGFGGLGNVQSGAEIFISDDGVSGPAVFTFPLAQVPGLPWDFPPAGEFTRQQIIGALDANRLWVRVLSGTPGTVELVGRLLPAPGWDLMPQPATPPAAPEMAADVAEAARFLTQATFGPNAAALTTLETQSFPQWIDAQIALPPTWHLPLMRQRRDEWLARGSTGGGWQGPRLEAWWQTAVDAPDQLRQRVAFALSEIFVISQNSALDIEYEGTAMYYDILVKHALGNYRELLDEVTKSPMMGTYLSMARNKKPDPVTGHQPDENYAREVMQLFSVGLSMRHTDGSLKLDSRGLPIPTYTQEDTVGLAHVFTGWGAHYDPEDPPHWDWDGALAGRLDWFQWGSDPLRPMSFYPEFHDRQDRRILGGVTIPGSLDGEQRMTMALDTIFNHPNVGPFMARHLIQKFVTSNPSPGYIHRVASVFNDNGSGVRGDLGATIKAVLLDHEARAPEARNSFSYGKPSEPLMRATRLLRLVPIDRPRAAQGDNRLFLNLDYHFPEQSPLNAPSVFNFYSPGYSSSGPIGEAGLISPEFQIFSETTAIRQANFFLGAMEWGLWVSEPEDEDSNIVLHFNFSELVAILNTPGKTPVEAQGLLLDHLNDRMLFGKMSPALRAEILAAYAALPGWIDHSASRQGERARMAIYLIANSPEFFVQK